MSAIDPLVRISLPLFAALSSIASYLFCCRTGVMVLSAVGRIRRNIWFEARALQCSQRARIVFDAAQGPPAQPPAPSPRRATITSEGDAPAGSQ